MITFLDLSLAMVVSFIVIMIIYEGLKTKNDKKN